MSLLTMYAAKAGSPKTALAETITADATSMTLYDATVLPSAPNICVIGEEENAEVVMYSGISGNTVTGLVRALEGSGTLSAPWSAGSTVARYFTSYDHNIFRENILDLENRKQENLTFDAIPTDSSTNPVTSGGVKTALDDKAPLNNPNLTGIPTAPTADTSANNTQIATTGYVKNNLSSYLPLSGGSNNKMTGILYSDNSSYKIQTDVNPNSPPSSGNHWTGGFYFSDINDTTVAYERFVQNASNQYSIYRGFQRTVNGTNKTNNLVLSLASDGTPTVSVNASAWLDALGAWYKNGDSFSIPAGHGSYPGYLVYANTGRVFIPLSKPVKPGTVAKVSGTVRLRFSYKTADYTDVELSNLTCNVIENGLSFDIVKANLGTANGILNVSSRSLSVTFS